MKMAKALAVVFALVLAVFCFNVPLVLAGDDVPWDEEGSGKLDGRGLVEDPTDSSKDNASSNSSTDSNDESSGSTSLFFLDVQLTTWYFGCLM